MSGNHLVCASCARPVIEGGCSVCRAVKADLHGQPMSVTTFTVALVALLVLAFALAAHA